MRASSVGIAPEKELFAFIAVAKRSQGRSIDKRGATSQAKKSELDQAGQYLKM
jgi:hypothetical protein